jgi:hypothetical protein
MGNFSPLYLGLFFVRAVCDVPRPNEDNSGNALLILNPHLSITQ